MQVDLLHPTLLRAALTAGATLNPQTQTLTIPQAQTTTFPYKPLSHHDLGIKGYTKRDSYLGDFETIVFDDAGGEHVIWRHPATDFIYELTRDRRGRAPRTYEYVKSYLGVDFEVVVRDFTRGEYIVWRVDLDFVKRLFEELGRLAKITPTAISTADGLDLSTDTSGETNTMWPEDQLRALLTRQPISVDSLVSRKFCQWNYYMLDRRDQDAPDISHFIVTTVLDLDGTLVILSTHSVSYTWGPPLKVTYVRMPETFVDEYERAAAGDVDV